MGGSLLKSLFSRGCASLGHNRLAGMLLMAVAAIPLLVGDSCFAQNLAGRYRIRTVGTGHYWVAEGDKGLINSESQPNNDFTWFDIVPAGNNAYQIKVKANGKHLHVDSNNDNMLSTRWQPNDDHTKFAIIPINDGTYKIVVKATGRHLHGDGAAGAPGWYISTRWQPNDNYTRFKLEKEEKGPVALFAEQYVVPTRIGGEVTDGWAVTSVDSEESAHETIVTRKLVTRNRPTITLKILGTAEDEKFGGNVHQLTTNHQLTKGIGSDGLIYFTKDKDSGERSRMLVNISGAIKKNDDQLIVMIGDNSEIQNELYKKTPHFVGPFFEELIITANGPTKGWRRPEFGPNSQNSSGGYEHSTSIGVDVNLGFQGKTPSAGVGGSWSQSSSSSAELKDIEYIKKSVDSQPQFRWYLGNVYDGPTRPVSYNMDPWSAIHKPSGQVDVVRSTHDAPKIAQATFQIVDYTSYEQTTNEALQDNFKLTFKYKLTTRTVFSTGRNMASIEELIKLNYSHLGLNPNMWTGEMFRIWGNVKIVDEFEIDVLVPKSVLTRPIR